MNSIADSRLHWLPWFFFNNRSFTISQINCEIAYDISDKTFEEVVPKEILEINSILWLSFGSLSKSFGRHYRRIIGKVLISKSNFQFKQVTTLSYMVHAFILLTKIKSVFFGFNLDNNDVQSAYQHRKSLKENS